MCLLVHLVRLDRYGSGFSVLSSCWCRPIPGLQLREQQERHRSPGFCPGTAAVEIQLSMESQIANWLRGLLADTILVIASLTQLQISGLLLCSDLFVGGPH